jgi:hypothetical protein
MAQGVSTTSMSMSSTFTGRVVSVNDKGIKLDGHTDWLNFSKFAEDLVAPERGQDVTVVVDRQGFIRSVQGALPRIAGGSDSKAPNETLNTLQHKDRTITRLAVLKAAAEFGAARPNLKSGHILSIAASWEKWVMREEETTYELTDAF